MYGATFAEEWPISRTPRLLAHEAAARVIELHEKELHLYSDSSSDDEDESAREKRAGRSAKTLMQLPSSLDTEDEIDLSPVPLQLSATRPSLKRKRSSTIRTLIQARRISMEMPAASVTIKQAALGG
jgi:hypothetical protein